MNIVKYSELVYMAELHSQACASWPYELIPNILRCSSLTYKYYRKKNRQITDKEDLIIYNNRK